jgi:ferredoxin
MVDHKAKLLRVDYCDGLGNCLPVCPTGAISFIETEADSAVEVRQWPIQIQLVPVTAPYFENAELLIAADCTAYAYRDFHRYFITGKTVLIGCPKLDAIDYSDKLTEIFSKNTVSSITAVKMEVPCCSGIENAVKTALEKSGKTTPLEVYTLTITGEVTGIAN